MCGTTVDSCKGLSTHLDILIFFDMYIQYTIYMYMNIYTVNIYIYTINTIHRHKKYFRMGIGDNDHQIHPAANILQ